MFLLQTCPGCVLRICGPICAESKLECDKCQQLELPEKCPGCEHRKPIISTADEAENEDWAAKKRK